MLTLTQKAHDIRDDHEDDVFLIVGDVEIVVKLISIDRNRARIAYGCPKDKVMILRRKLYEQDK